MFTLHQIILKNLLRECLSQLTRHLWDSMFNLKEVDLKCKTPKLVHRTNHRLVSTKIGQERTTMHNTIIAKMIQVAITWTLELSKVALTLLKKEQD